jgi:hypothetical protein
LTVQYLEETKTMFLEATRGLTVAQWRFQPAPETWSIAGCAEHLAVVEDYLLAMVQKMVDGPSASPEELAQVEGKGELVLKMVAGRRRKAQAPNWMLPANRWPTLEDSTAQFITVRDRTIAFAHTMDGRLCNHIAPHFALGPLNGEQWLLFIAAHTERHVKQIMEVRADAEFPE